MVYYAAEAMQDGRAIKLSTEPAGQPPELTEPGSGQSYMGKLPAKIEQAILMMAASFYRNHVTMAEVGQEVSPPWDKIPQAALWLLDSNRRIPF